MSVILAQARLRACQRWPFASHAILSMVPVPRPGLGTLSVDQHWRLYYDEAALTAMDTEEAAGVILHELDHLLKRHHKRGRLMVGEDVSRWDTWNIATDAAINAGLRSEGIPLPDGVIYPERIGQPDGLCAEEYFRNLIDQQQENNDGQTPTDEAAEDDQSNVPADDGTGSGTGDQGPAGSDAQGPADGTDGGATGRSNPSR
jgi:predicted metal-dependent peptidase